MIKLVKSLKALTANSKEVDFKDILKKEIEQLDITQLPLQQGLSTSSYVADSKINAIILSNTETEKHFIVKAGIFYSGIIAGCSCADDPTPVEEQTEYCEVQLTIDKLRADTTVELLSV